MSALKSLWQDRAHALVSIFGLAVGMGFCLLLLAYARYSWSYDGHVPDIDRVYVVKHRRNWELGKPWSEQIPLAVREPASSLPGVAAVTGYAHWFPLRVQEADGLRATRSLVVLPGFAQMLGLRALRGDLTATLDAADSIAITEAGARRLFGSADVLGRILTLRLDAADVLSGQVRIGAVLPTPPTNTTIPYEILHGLNLNMLPPWARDEALTGAMGFSGGYLLLKLAPGGSASEVTAALQLMAENSPLARQVPDPIKAHAGRDRFTEIRLSPLREAYFDDQVGINAFSKDVPRGNPRVVAGVTMVAALLLLLAAVNYVNLTTLRVLRRQREITLRKVLGASRRRLAREILVEALSISGLATAFGVTLAAVALPAFGELVGRDLAGMLSPANVLAAAAIGLLLGMATAIYPAWIALRARPAALLTGRGDDESARGRRWRRALSVAQLALAMGLAGVTLAVSIQTRHALAAPLGFDAGPLLVANLPIGMSAGDGPLRQLREALAQHPAIAGVAVAVDALGRNREVWSTDFQRDDGDLRFLELKGVSANFFELHGLAPLAGRLFRSDDTGHDSSSPLVLNEESARLLGFTSPALAIGQHVRVRGMQMSMEDHVVVGVAPRLRFNSLREAPPPVVYMISDYGSTLIVRARGARGEAERAMHDLWPRFLPNALLEIRRADDAFAESYADDERLARLLALATLLALSTAAGGAYVLAADAVRRRRREYALRKLFGARGRHVAMAVARELGMLLAVAAAIGLPLAAIVIARYLAPFSDRAPLAYAALVVAAGVAALVVTLAAWRQAWRAMRLAPAVVLRS